MPRRHHRRHHERHHHYRHNPNPRFLGEDVADLAVKASGLALTQFVNQQFAAPIVRNVVRNQSGIMGKAVDVGTTAISAVVAGQGVGLVSRRYGRDVQFGGLILTAGKGLGAVVPGFSLGTPTLPQAFQRFGLPGSAPVTAMAGPAAVALPALPPGGQANYPRPATVDSDVGL